MKRTQTDIHRMNGVIFLVLHCIQKMAFETSFQGELYEKRKYKKIFNACHKGQLISE